jgi:hypothetical protein
MDFWKSMEKRRGERIGFRIVDPRDSYLSDVQATLSEWESEEDDKAFHDL